MTTKSSFPFHFPDFQRHLNSPSRARNSHSEHKNWVCLPNLPTGKQVPGQGSHCQQAEQNQSRIILAMYLEVSSTTSSSILIFFLGWLCYCCPLFLFWFLCLLFGFFIVFALLLLWGPFGGHDTNWNWESYLYCLLGFCRMDIKMNKERDLPLKIISWVPVAHNYNPNYSRGLQLRPTWAKVHKIPISPIDGTHLSSQSSRRLRSRGSRKKKKKSIHKTASQWEKTEHGGSYLSSQQQQET
jgi:hypothetical protein